jgi:hypothetical protein
MSKHAASFGSRRHVVAPFALMLVQTTESDRPQIDCAAHRRAVTPQSADIAPVATSSRATLAAHRTYGLCFEAAAQSHRAAICARTVVSAAGSEQSAWPAPGVATSQKIASKPKEALHRRGLVGR